jgi:hypothetical protein
MATSSLATVLPEVDEAPAADLLVRVRDVVRLLDRAVRNRQLYPADHSVFVTARTAARAGLATAWTEFASIALELADTGWHWQGVPLAPDAERGRDPLAWTLYRDGVREIVLLPGFEGGELDAFLELMPRVAAAGHDGEDDMLTLLWERDFAFLTYELVERDDMELPSLYGSGEPGLWPGRGGSGGAGAGDAGSGTSIGGAGSGDAVAGEGVRGAPGGGPGAAGGRASVSTGRMTGAVGAGASIGAGEGGVALRPGAGVGGIAPTGDGTDGHGAGGAGGSGSGGASGEGGGAAGGDAARGAAGVASASRARMSRAFSMAFGATDRRDLVLGAVPDTTGRASVVMPRASTAVGAGMGSGAGMAMQLDRALAIEAAAAAEMVEGAHGPALRGYLDDGVAREYGTPVRRAVIDVLLDVLLRPEAADAHRDTARALAAIVPFVLADGSLDDAVYLLTGIRDVRESSSVAGAPYAASVLQSIVAHISTPDAVRGLVLAAEVRGALTAAVAQPFLALVAPSALEACLSLHDDVKDRIVIQLLADASARLAREAPGELLTLLGRTVSPEVAQRAVKLAAIPGYREAVAPLARAYGGGRAPVVRLAIVEALAAIGTAEAHDALIAAINDIAAEVRIAAMRALTASAYAGAWQAAREAALASDLDRRSPQEVSALFELFGATCDADGVTMLDTVLNDRGGFLRRRADRSARVNAALALGTASVRHPAARAALVRAQNDDDLVVRRAVQRALPRGGA